MTDEIKVHLGNRWAEFEEPFPREVVDALTCYTVPNVYFMPAYHRYHEVLRKIDGTWHTVQERVWDGKIHLLKGCRLPAGLFCAIAPALEQQGLICTVYDNRIPVVEINPRDWDAFRLRHEFVRPYQWEAVKKMMAASRTGGLLLNATGTGKTLIAGLLFKLAHPATCLFVVDQLTLLRQARDELTKILQEPVGSVGESEIDIQRVTVATVQTLALHRQHREFAPWFAAVDILVLDEIHSQLAKRDFSVVTTVQPKAVFGLTATLKMRKKDIRLRAQALCGPVVYEYPLEQGVRERYLTPVCSVALQFWNPQSVLGRYSDDYPRLISRKKARNQLIEELTRLLVQEDTGSKIVVLADRIHHLKILHRRLRDTKIALVYGDKTSRERRQILHRFERLDGLQVILTNRVFEKGVDIKAVQHGINATGYKDESKAVQFAGRLVRLHSDKRYVICWDVYDQGNRFERNARRRMKALRAVKIPVIRTVFPLSQGKSVQKAWLSKIQEQVEKKLGLNVRKREDFETFSAENEPVEVGHNSIT